MDQHSFFFNALIYLSAAVVFVPLAKKLGLGSVLGYLLAGIFIGPNVMAFTGSQGQDILHFAEFGVVMMLFLIGIELEPELLWKLRASIVGMGGIQVVATTALVAGLAFLMGLPWQSALAIGMILSLSSTAIVLQSLEEKGIMSSAAGQSAFSVLLFQDIAVIPMLAIFPLLAPAGAAPHTGEHTFRENLPGWEQTLVVIGAVSIIILAGRYLVRPLLRVVAGTRIRELFTTCALLLVVAVTVLMTMVGLSPALGAFLGGVVLANSEYRAELESDIAPFKGLLLGLFFMAVGASIDFRLVLSTPLQILGFVLALMLLKGLLLFGLGKIFRLSRDQNMLFAVSLSQVGEFAFVLLSFSRQTGILSLQTTSVVTAAVALSMAFTPLMMMLYEKLLQPRFTATEDATREADAINVKNPVILAGFGKSGNIIGRFLLANGVPTTILDLDSDRIDLLHNLGIRAYYGDASRYDLLKAAGAEEAKLIIIATGSIDQTTDVVKVVRKHFPDLQMLVKAETITDVFDLMELGVLNIYREPLDTSLRMGADALRILGHRAYNARRAAATFRRHDEKALKELSALRNDRKSYLSMFKERIEEISILINKDKTQPWNNEAEGWNERSLLATSGDEEDTASAEQGT
ncbi:monovalent cation:proton antiporter-2 (CPA2) family protein [uncultured Chitinophaga sp.]|jgi:transporter, monovalent cation:proton antiporter-2 (CPA2) family|uniref:monovalent cation:proton antiporter-2 (CPA2) family protein n=1 Tax=uncultured Chitinophaga sp. TaxID=339340 RepID=UPI0026293F64|nr:monovalent cation:proton antiporter-2 (CPA2) family protein [uncultured Chitinophaga sp.]